MLASGFYTMQWERSATNTWLYNNYLKFSTAATASLIGVWGMRIAYRALKVTTWESFAFTFAATISMLQSAPLGALLFPWSATITYWLFMYPYVGIMKGMVVGIGVGMIAYSVRYLLGREMHAFGVAEEVAE
jgi:hypothetical protein